MKKKIMAILMTVVMGLSLCGMSPVSAEETKADFLGAYTLDEFLAMGEEEIGAITEGIDCSNSETPLHYYAVAKEQHKFEMAYALTKENVEAYAWYHVEFQEGLDFCDEETKTVDIAALAAALRIPESMIGSADLWSGGTMYPNQDVYSIMLDKESFSSYGCKEHDMIGKLNAWFMTNPDVIFGGYFRMPKAVPAYTPGEINMDEKVSVLDVILLNKYVIGSVDLNEEQILAGNCYWDDRIDMNDVDTLMRYIVDMDGIIGE